MTDRREVRLTDLSRTARAQIEAALGKRSVRRRSTTAASGDTCSYRCGDCGHETHPDVDERKYAYTRAVEHSVEKNHPRIDVIL